MWANNVPAQASLLDFSPLLALWTCTPTQTCHRIPCPLSTCPLLHLCFMTALGVVPMAVTAPSITRVPFGIVTCLSCLA